MRAARRARKLQEFAENQRNRNHLYKALESNSPVERRLGALGIGRGERGEDLPALEEKLRNERAGAARTALATAWVRCGGTRSEVPGLLLTNGCSRRHTDSLERLQEDMGLVLDSDPIELRTRLDQDPGAARDTLRQLCAHQWMEDRHRINVVQRAGGRRTEHACLEAMGRLGCSSYLSPLLDGLDEIHVDPGRGLAHRRVAAEALGRLGLPEAYRSLKRALVWEERELGAPGAGMGMQFPVRDTLIQAIGELQDPRSIPLLCRYLGAVEESPLGGLHLPAMEALWKLGPEAIPALQLVARKGLQPAASHAVSLLDLQ